MSLLREPARNPLARTIARVLILALVLGLTPIEARAARTTAFNPAPPLPTPRERVCSGQVEVWVFFVVRREPVTKDPVGNRQTQVTTLGPAGSAGPNLQPGTIGYGYDTRDRLLSEQLDANPATGYGWDHNGNLTTKDAEATYTWNAENRLTRVERPVRPWDEGGQAHGSLHVFSVARGARWCLSMTTGSLTSSPPRGLDGVTARYKRQRNPVRRRMRRWPHLRLRRSQHPPVKARCGAERARSACQETDR